VNFYKLIRITPMPTRIRLSLRRYLLDREKDREWLMHEYDSLEEDENSYHTRRLRTRARNLRIPMPPVFEGAKVTSDYVSSGLDGKRYYLSISGEQKVRAAIREEEKYRSERWTRRIPYITALTGLIGAGTGLVALLSKWGN
jgi:hypothetical protein